MIEVLNKIDLLEAGPREGLLAANRRGGPLAVSALTGAGLPALLARFEQAVTHGNTMLTLSLDSADGGALAFAYRHGQVLQRRDRAGKVGLVLKADPSNLSRLQSRFGGKIKLKQRPD